MKNCQMKSLRQLPAAFMLVCAMTCFTYADDIGQPITSTGEMGQPIVSTSDMHAGVTSAGEILYPVMTILLGLTFKLL
jgi:hypothetical protein